MSVFTSADYESAITTEYIEELAEEFGLDEIALIRSTKRELNSETQEFIAISGSSDSVITNRFLVCVDFWEILEICLCLISTGINEGEETVKCTRNTDTSMKLHT